MSRSPNTPWRQSLTGLQYLTSILGGCGDAQLDLDRGLRSAYRYRDITSKPASTSNMTDASGIRYSLSRSLSILAAKARRTNRTSRSQKASDLLPRRDTPLEF
ncbi:hypothetical protein WAI453_013555 [Rhynchosporium graminicola]